MARGHPFPVDPLGLGGEQVGGEPAGADDEGMRGEIHAGDSSGLPDGAPAGHG
jgi:hypothetical protein